MGVGWGGVVLRAGGGGGGESRLPYFPWSRARNLNRARGGGGRYPSPPPGRGVGGGGGEGGGWGGGGGGDWVFWGVGGGGPRERGGWAPGRDLSREGLVILFFRVPWAGEESGFQPWHGRRPRRAPLRLFFFFFGCAADAGGWFFCLVGPLAFGDRGGGSRGGKEEFLYFVFSFFKPAPRFLGSRLGGAGGGLGKSAGRQERGGGGGGVGSGVVGGGGCLGSRRGHAFRGAAAARCSV